MPILPLLLFLSFQPTKSLNDHHVLLIGIDGCRYDAFRRAVSELRTATLYPHFLSLIDHGVVAEQLYAGGHDYDGTGQLTKSGPGWATLLSGVWADRHRVVSNDNVSNFLTYEGQSLFSEVKYHYPKADIVTLADWAPLGMIFAHRK